jgi:molybdenum cofactor synthesis domain-containing protein
MEAMSPTFAGHTVAVVTVSDRAAMGERADATGPVLAAAFTALGAVVDALVVADEREAITAAITSAIASGAIAVVTTGGTGVGPRDVTPEATAVLIETDLPGIPELLRARDASANALVALSRARAGLSAPPERALIVNLPGSPSAVHSALEVLPHLVAHVHTTSRGSDH